ncbi:bifunctional proline dehydrogenase/L-glutamate gamma-semialdehyde dehydrogenase [Actinomycetospora sp. TBRC 11914]|uniref:bifunctional proline dehydrogenase/L-glutamate gamma-semialdehyde dehydrogenase n=1 Tax=Actinomycetospora sp. TBRC 11914 TaxID=2729387 RepID=UPI00145E3D70|nr:bifunctional proline dehydrogenase/L-glutamate gamma-semialdehyde dehydrogenase [Actinomycetospora sp. TBRC 11914]NMO88723.1 bifunctional proline dehydrogenase/L-glutamate gamma-semialdehyde dehydrogenase [Actinomycetospora sp. TBRC 11914]
MSEQVIAPTAEIDEPMVERAVGRAARWSEASVSGGHDTATRRLASLVHDPDGVEFALRFVDRVARPDDDRVAARELARLAGRGATLPGFANLVDRTMLRAGAVLAPQAPRLVVPLARRRLRALVGHLVVDASGRTLRRHLAAARAQGRRLNLNLLGEAVLGEAEADRRLERTLALIRRPDVDYVSVKASAVASQLVPWDLEGSRDRLVERLTPLVEAARDEGVFVNLDMEEYKDLDLTLALFTTLLSRPGLEGYSAGIVLQAYLPDSVAALEQVAAFARRRVAAGGAPVKVRLVKGANLAMERVDAALHDWPQAPYATKAEVDANYVRLLDHALRPELADALRVGVASHHLHHVALAVELAAARGVERQMDVEMLQGMAPAQADAVAADLPSDESLVLYTPVVHREDFDAAVSYLVRRLEENAGQENYLYAMFSAAGPSSYVDRFRASVRDRDTVADSPRRTQDRSAEMEAMAHSLHLTPGRRRSPADEGGFHNEPDTDPSLPANRDWARRAVAATPAVEREPELTDPAAVDVVLDRAAASTWGTTAPEERARLLREAARALAVARTELLTVMVGEAGKTVAEADPEISEVIDFAAYYADRAAELAPTRFSPARVVVVTPPWNFPVAIPLGGCLAALAAGAAVVIKPAPQVRACAEVGVAALHRAGIPADALQLVHTDEGAAGQRLITHPAVERVVLTGASATAALFRSWRPDLPLIAETSGKNALVVTPAADPDLAVADLVRSAFGHAGQKCSAASLAILVGPAGDPRSAIGRRLRRQLVDAVTTLRVGDGRDLGTTMGPLVGELTPQLERALTTLDDGESWLVEPRHLGGAQWTPGVRDGVAPGSWFHRTECFGPVLGLMTAATLDEAIAWQNDTGFGLTGGLHSLDADEIEYWGERVEVGNAYVNRHITGAIVQRQSFGGWKGSVVGPGAKPGGPNYVAQFGTWRDPSELPAAPVTGPAADLLAAIAPSVAADDLAWLRAAAGSDAAAWRDEFGVEHDPTGIAAEANVFRYRPLPSLRLVVGVGAAPRDVLRVRLAGACAGVAVVEVGDDVEPVPGERLRAVGEVPTTLRRAAAEVGASLVDTPVLADGRREMLSVLREQAVSVTRHRFGHVEA